jgi:hypothetical protein
MDFFFFWLGIVRSTYPRDDRASSDRSAFADCAMRHDDRSRTDVDFVFDSDGASREFGLAAFAQNRLIGAAENDVLADVHAAADADVACVFDCAIRAEERVVADVDVVAVVARERADDNDS